MARTRTQNQPKWNRRRFLGISALLGLGFSAPPVRKTNAWAHKVLVRNRSSHVTPDQLQQVVSAVQHQIDDHFYPCWGLRPALHVVSDGFPAGLCPEVCLVDDPDFYFGTHYFDRGLGVPAAQIFVARIQKFQLPWSITFSHEVLEMIANPMGTFSVNAIVGNSIRYYCLEVCDPCSRTEYSYMIGDTAVSDFVTPAWFENRSPKSERYDFAGKIEKPLTVLPGCYSLFQEL